MSRLLDADELAEARDDLWNLNAALARKIDNHIDALTEQLAAERVESDRFHRELRDALTGNRQVVQR